MGKIQKHLPVKLITALTYHSSIDIKPIFSELEDLFSQIDIITEVYDFSEFTSYYEKEMGKKLLKRFMAFEELIDPEQLPSAKISTNNLEDRFLVNEKRRINIDPGYITQAKLVLATTKNYSHRIYIGRGIFGDVHMQYKNKSYHGQPWTYPDYITEQNIRFFNNVRTKYLKQLATTS
jgi:hypothetical protein